MIGGRELTTLEEWSIGRRFLEDVWAAATASYWERRARQLDDARPRSGDFTGRATPDEIAAQDQRLAAAAEACRLRGRFLDISRGEFNDTLTDLADLDRAGDRAA